MEYPFEKQLRLLSCDVGIQAKSRFLIAFRPRSVVRPNIESWVKSVLMVLILIMKEMSSHPLDISYSMHKKIEVKHNAILLNRTGSLCPYICQSPVLNRKRIFSFTSTNVKDSSALI